LAGEKPLPLVQLLVAAEAQVRRRILTRRGRRRQEGVIFRFQFGPFRKFGAKIFLFVSF
jgi:hypothetical protein